MPASWPQIEAKVDAIVARYGCDPSWTLLGYESGAVPIGCIGLFLAGAGEAVIGHIAVAPAYRLRGIGRSLVDDALRRFELSALTAKTDATAVGFHRSCGFEIRSLGELYPGVERFRCELRR